MAIENRLSQNDIYKIKPINEVIENLFTSLSSDIENILSESIIKSEKWIYFNIQNDFELKNIISNLQNIFKNWYYIIWLNYKELQEYIFNWRELTWSKIFLWKKIEKFNLEEKDLYSKRYRDKWWIIVFEFSKMLIEIEEKSKNWKTRFIDKEIEIDIDKILAILIENWIVFWFMFEKIIESIQNYKSNKSFSIINICNKQEPKDWMDVKFELLKRVTKDLTPIIDENTDNVDFKRYQCSFPQIKNLNDNKILKKISANEWMPWIDIYWKEIKQKQWKNININKYVGKWTQVEIIDWVEYLVAKEIWYINKDPKGIISIYPKALNQTQIWPKTWIIDIWDNEIIQIWDIFKWYWIYWNNIFMESWDLYWFINSNWWKILIKWNIYWWQVVNEKWDIIIMWQISSESYIKSIIWNIDLNYVENSTIIWNNIKIKKAVNCKIIWNYIEINEWIWNNIHWIWINILHSNIKSIIISPIYLSFLSYKKIKSYELYISCILPEINEIKNKTNILIDKINKVKEKEDIKKSLNIYEDFKKWKINESKLDLKKKTILKKIFQFLENNLFYLEKELDELNKILDIKNKDYHEVIIKIQEEQKYIEQVQEFLINNQNINVDKITDWDIEIKYYFPKNNTFNHLLNIDNYNEFLWYTKFPSSIKHKTFEKKVERSCNIKYDDIKLFIEELYKDSQLEDKESLSNKRLYHRLELINSDDLLRVLNWENIINPNLKININLDWIWEWIIIDFSWKWLGIWIKNNLKKEVMIDKWDNIKIEFKCFDTKIKNEFYVKRIIKEEWYIILWWIFQWMNHDEQKKIVDMKNRLEIIKVKWNVLI